VVTFARVREIDFALPSAEEAISCGTLMAKTALGHREALIETVPDR
jgi:hypothetical protein